VKSIEIYIIFAAVYNHLPVMPFSTRNSRHHQCLCYVSLICLEIC